MLAASCRCWCSSVATPAATWRASPSSRLSLDKNPDCASDHEVAEFIVSYALLLSLNAQWYVLVDVIGHYLSRIDRLIGRVPINKVYVRFAPLATTLVRWRNMSRRAKFGSHHDCEHVLARSAWSREWDRMWTRRRKCVVPSKRTCSMQTKQSPLFGRENDRTRNGICYTEPIAKVFQRVAERI